MHDTYLLIERRINGVAYPPINLGVHDSHHARDLAKGRWTEKHYMIKVLRMDPAGEVEKIMELRPHAERPGEWDYVTIPRAVYI